FSQASLLVLSFAQASLQVLSFAQASLPGINFEKKISIARKKKLGKREKKTNTYIVPHLDFVPVKDFSWC
ncbi:1171_t:CDS:1, partial [Gigaspora margarita]